MLTNAVINYNCGMKQAHSKYMRKDSNIYGFFWREICLSSSSPWDIEQVWIWMSIDYNNITQFAKITMTRELRHFVIVSMKIWTILFCSHVFRRTPVDSLKALHGWLDVYCCWPSTECQARFEIVNSVVSIMYWHKQCRIFARYTIQYIHWHCQPVLT